MIFLPGRSTLFVVLLAWGPAYLLNLKLLMKIMTHNKKTKQGRIMQEIYVCHSMGEVTLQLEIEEEKHLV